MARGRRRPRRAAHVLRGGSVGRRREPRRRPGRAAVARERGLRFHAEQLRQRRAVLRLADRVGVVVRTALDQYEQLGHRGRVIQLAAQRGVDQAVGRAVHHEQGRGDVLDRVDRLEALGDEGAEGQPAPLEAAHHVGDRGEGAFHDHAAFVVHVRRQVDADGAAERVAEDVTMLFGMARGQPGPGGAGVFAGRFLGGQALGALPEAAIVDGQHRKAQLMHALDARRRAGDVVAGAVQVQQHGRVGRFGLAAQPQAV